jgi:cold shock CspA family protein
MSNRGSYQRVDSLRSNSSRRSSSNRGSRRPSNLQSLPMEQGIICTLKESFGFIHCAERPEELFFHYSEVSNCHPDELQIDTEVEFKVGTAASSSGSSSSLGEDKPKLACFQVNALQPGTVVWETEDEEGKIYRGIVEKQARGDSGRGGSGGVGGKNIDADGSIRVLEEDFDATNDNDDDKKKGGPIVRLRAGEYTGDKVEQQQQQQRLGESMSSIHSNSNNPRLFRGDLVEFRILTDRRTKQKYARHIKLVKSDKEQRAVEKEKKLLENAVAEEGIIVSLNQGFGFIRSNKRRDDVYFHYSHVVSPREESKMEAANGEAAQEDDFELKTGQQVKFLVVTDTDAQNSNRGSSKETSSNAKISARKVEMLPPGSVVFHTDVAKGVKGMVSMPPHPPSPGIKGDDSKEGKVRLLEPIKLDAPDTDIGGDTVHEVLLHYSDAPGGVFTYQNHRNQAVSAVWIYEGDTLLFDIIKETVDGSYRAIPTLHTVEVGGSIKAPKPEGVAEENAKPAIRMLATTLVGRAEGTVNTIRNDYGFIHFSERPIDVHFKMYDLLPEEMQDDIRKCMGIEGPVKLEPGCGVQFDILAHGNITLHGGSQRGRQGRSNSPHERENIRGQRLVILPTSAIVVDVNVATGIKGVVKVTDPKQLYAGSIDVEEEVHRMSLEQRHPLVAKMLDSFLEESSTRHGRKQMVYRDTLSMKDDDIVVEMAMIKGKGLLACSHVPIPGISPHPGRLCIRRVEKDENGEEKESQEAQTAGTIKKAKKGSKNFRFDKSSLVDYLKEDIPPAPEDVVCFDIVESRRSGNIWVRNMTITERKNEGGVPAEIVTSEGSGVGVVKDVVPKRNFGFVSVLDDNATRRELLFFHLPNDRRGQSLRKGDEVKFDIALEGTKRVATNVKKVPKGTIPSTASKNACLGYVLMEPSHTSLSDTPMRKTTSNMSGGGEKLGNSRWAEAKDDGKKNNQLDMPEEGCILLLEDKTGMFQRRNQTSSRKKRSTSVDSSGSMDSFWTDDGKSIDGKSVDTADYTADGDLSSDGGTSDNDAPGNSGIINILSHLRYRNGSIAIHGAGATNSVDGSTNPRRGDLVSFVKGRKRNTVRDIRVESRQKATFLQGRLVEIQRVDTEDSKNKGIAKFIAATEKEEVYDIDLAEVVSCDAKVLKDKETVEGVLFEGKIYGVCRTCDLYLTSKLGTSRKERPKLNLTVKKDRGGKILAQSMMAKGPDGTNGFKAGWTMRTSQYASEAETK